MSLVRKSILTVSGNVFGVVLSIVTQMILTRKLMPAGMGQYQVFLDAGVMAANVTTLGIGQAGVYFLNRKKEPVVSVVMNAFYWWCICNVILIVAWCIVVKTFVGYFGEQPFFAIVCYAVGITGILFNNLLLPVLTAALRMTEAVIVTSTMPLVYLISTAVFAMTGQLGVSTALIALACGYIFSAIILLFFLRKDIDMTRKFHFPFFCSMLAYGVQLFLSNITLIASSSIGVLLLRQLLMDFSQVGYFGRAVAICGMSKIITSSVTGMLYAKFSGSSSTERVSQVERAFRLQFAINIVVLLCIFAFGKWAMIILYGRAFLPAVLPMYILVISEILKSMVAIHSNLFASDGKPLLSMFVFGISIPIIIVLQLILTPRFGIVGAAWSQSIASFTGLCLATIISKRLYGIKFKSSLLLNMTDIHYVKQSFFAKNHNHIVPTVEG